MKKHIKRLICYSLITLVGINFNTEARLPKYMAQKAAELLIKGSNVGIKDEILDPKETKIEDLLCLKDIKPLVNAPVRMDSKNKKIEKIEKIEGIVDEILKNIKSKVTDKETFEKALLSSAIKDTLLQKIKDSVQRTGTGTEKLNNIKEEIIKELKCFIYASKLVDFLYTTEKRQYLADWFIQAFDKKTKGCKRLFVKNASENLKTFLMDLDNVNGNTYLDGKFVNDRFPCWTGTLTCFRIAQAFLAYNVINTEALNDRLEFVNQLKKELENKSLIEKSNLEKLISCLFVLEIVDEWQDIEKLTNTKEEQPPHPNDYDPYECVPVPNTMYYLPNKTPQGSCMVSVIRNLLCILCRNKDWNYEENKSLRKEVNEYIKTFDNEQEGVKTSDLVPGTTSPFVLREFADIVLPSQPTKQYQPTLNFFIFSLNELLKPKKRKITDTTKELLYKNIPSLTLLDKIFRKITGHGESLSTILEESKRRKNGQTWYDYKIKIEDKVVNKKVTIDIRKIGDGYHMEIIDIK